MSQEKHPNATEDGSTHSNSKMQSDINGTDIVDPDHQRQDCVALSLEDKDEVESPPTHSLFLCPSNLSALIESATSMSLGVASSREKEGMDKTGMQQPPAVLIDNDKGACYFSGTGDDNITLRGRPSPDRYVPQHEQSPSDCLYQCIVSSGCIDVMSICIIILRHDYDIIKVLKDNQQLEI